MLVGEPGVFSGIKRIGKPEVFGFVVLKCKKNTVWEHSVVFFLQQVSSKNHTRSKCQIRQQILWKKPTYAMLGLGCALVHCVGRFHQPEALLPAWPLVLLMLSTMLAVWKPGGFEHDFSGTSWEGFKDDCDTMKFTRNQIWKLKSLHIALFGF